VDRIVLTLLRPWRAGYQWDYVFDWTILKHQQSGTVPRPAPVARPEPAAGEGEEAADPAYGGR
jgi:casein kinase 1